MRIEAVLRGGLLAMAVAVGTTIFAAAAPPTSISDRILQQELRQQQIRTLTQRVGDQLESIIAEFERNDISGEDVKVLRAIRGVLGKLTEKDMEHVIELLQKARGSQDAQAATRSATDAFAGQKVILIALKQLILEYQRQQALYEMSLRFKELARRQTDNMWLGVWLARKTEGRPLNSFDEGQQINLKFQQTEQGTLKDETAFLINKLESLAKEIDDGPTAERPRAALQQVRDGGVNPALESAVEELKTGRLLSATGSEKKARDQMREIARLLILSPDATDALRQAINELERAIDDEKRVLADTQKVEKDTAAEVETRQAAVVDAADLIRRDVDSLAPDAVEHLKTAIDRMQEARGLLSGWEEPKKKREKASAKELEAISGMEQARRALQEQLARAEEKASRPENLLQALKQLQEQVRELARNEENLKQTAIANESKDRKQLAELASRQGEMKDQAQELQSQAAEAAPAAAQSLGEAASEMQKSQAALAQNKNNAPAQQAAVDALQKADQQLGQEIARLEEAARQLAMVEEMLKRLEAVIGEQQQVQLGTAKEALKPQASADANRALAGRQGKLGQDTGQLQGESAAPVPDASAHLGKAREQMDAARSQLEKTAPKTAQPGQTGALNELYLAKRDMERKADQLREALGMPPGGSPQSLADAAAVIDQAIQDVNQARAEMMQSEPGLLDSLAQQQRQIADGLAQQSQGAPAAAPVSKAQQAASQAAAQLGQANLPAAISSMEQAQRAMQQAMPSGEQGEQGGGKADGQQGQGTPSPSGQPAAPGGREGAPSMPQLSQQQAEVRKAAEALMAAQQAAPASATADAAQLLGGAAGSVGPVAAGAMGPLPPSAQAALQAAEGSLIQGAAQASAGQSAPAQGSAASAAQALAQAQAALALAQAGLNAEAAAQGQGQGQGQAQGQGQGQSQGQGQAQGQGKGQGQGQGQGRGTPSPQGTGRVGNWAGAGGADGPRRNAAGASQYSGLPKRDRAAIQQSQGEKYPQEYGPLVEQYLKNLSDQSGGK